MASNEFKHALFTQFARVGKALSHPYRLELLDYLAQAEHTVEQLAERVGLSVANASQHLQQLRRAGLVSTRKEGLYVHYRIVGDEVVGLIDALGRVAECNLAEVERLVASNLEALDDVEPLPSSELLARAREGDVTVLDVRPAEEYAQGHLADAVNVPLGELEAHLRELPKDQEIVAYCRGPYCVLAYEAVARLRERGYRARRLEYGYPEWKAEGHPVEVGAGEPEEQE
ncbi:MAG: metalloregulator ArsR/SmtB family transcription factor [Gammaproteobacteria bacterium]|nr:metalloregulator ArsR/SmtB family transcription factor [Gammaproteobacteria bacterium]